MPLLPNSARRMHSPTTGRTGSRGTLVGSAEGPRPLPAGGRLVGNRRKECMSKRGTPCRMPPHQPAGIAKPVVSIEESSTLVPQRGHPLCATVPHRKRLRRQGGRGPLDPRLPWHVGS